MKTAEHYIERMKAQSEQNVARWGEQDKDKLVLVCIEELGELAQAYLQHAEEDGDQIRIIEEAIDLGAVGFQFGVEPDLGYGITRFHLRPTIVGTVEQNIRSLSNSMRDLNLYPSRTSRRQDTGEIVTLCAAICVEVARNADA